MKNQNAPQAPCQGEAARQRALRVPGVPPWFELGIPGSQRTDKWEREVEQSPETNWFRCS